MANPLGAADCYCAKWLAHEYTVTSHADRLVPSLDRSHSPTGTTGPWANLRLHRASKPNYACRRPLSTTLYGRPRPVPRPRTTADGDACR